MFTPRQPEKSLPINADAAPTRTSPDADDFYYTPEGFLVFTEAYHRKRGYCCKNGCRHCPYGFKKSEP